MKSYTILAVTLVVASLVVKNSEAGYKKLNNYLIENVKDNDAVGLNMEAAVNWLKELEGAKRSLFSSSPIDEVRKFTALQQVIDDTNCDGKTYELIESSVKEVDLIKLLVENQVIRRVDKLLLAIFRNHAHKCLPVYLVNYQAKKEQYDPEEFGLLQKLARRIMDSNSSKSYYKRLMHLKPSELFSEYITKSLSPRTFSGGNLHQYLLTIGSSDPLFMHARKVANERTGYKEVHKNEIKELVRKFIIEPCRRYKAHFGPDLFVPAISDARFYHEVDNSNEDFYHGWFAFRICQVIIFNESEAINDVISSVERMS